MSTMDSDERCTRCMFEVHGVAFFCRPLWIDKELFGSCGRLICENCSNDYEICAVCASDLYDFDTRTEKRICELGGVIDELELFVSEVEPLTRLLDDRDLCKLFLDRQESLRHARSELKELEEKQRRIRSEINEYER